jgi:hypothetical protein
MDSLRSRALQLFEYRKDGKLLWRAYRSSNARKGDVAGYMKSHGYMYVSVDDKRYLVHRIIFLMHHGFLPENVDHINTVRDDNRIENLRAASMSQNAHNAKLSAGNSSGFKGVSWCKKKQKWRANICTKYRQTHIGYFDTAELASDAYANAALAQHGEFARTI